MRNIIILTVFLAILAIAIIGCLTIFEIMAMEAAKSMLIKFEAALLLLGGCSALIALLTGAKKQAEVTVVPRTSIRYRL